MQIDAISGGPDAFGDRARVNRARRATVAPGVAASSRHAAQKAFLLPARAGTHRRGHAAGKIYHPM
ncbi:hypothetical protein [Cupriavidus taiwanensis]|uniref:hypothetical protein n=1 Tax=Cupriavidus taiwanensis TaxID=164546 RepID=UPI0011C025C0|nr:hypothetical protein [Cupriavidus taiwanensis]